MSFTIVLNRIVKHDERDNGNTFIYDNEYLRTVKDYNSGIAFMQEYRHQLINTDYLFLVLKKQGDDPSTVYYMTLTSEGTSN